MHPCTPIPMQPSEPAQHPSTRDVTVTTTGMSPAPLRGCHHYHRRNVTIARCPAPHSITGEVLGAARMGWLLLLPSSVTIPPHPLAWHQAGACRATGTLRGTRATQCCREQGHQYETGGIPKDTTPENLLGPGRDFPQGSLSLLPGTLPAPLGLPRRGSPQLPDMGCPARGSPRRAVPEGGFWLGFPQGTKMQAHRGSGRPLLTRR